MNILKSLVLFSVILMLFALVSIPVAAGGSLPQPGATASIPQATAVGAGEGTTISGDFYTALQTIVGFTCFSSLLLIAIIWFLNKRRQSL